MCAGSDAWCVPSECLGGEWHGIEAKNGQSV